VQTRSVIEYRRTFPDCRAHGKSTTRRDRFCDGLRVFPAIPFRRPRISKRVSVPSNDINVCSFGYAAVYICICIHHTTKHVRVSVRHCREYWSHDRDTNTNNDCYGLTVTLAVTHVAYVSDGLVFFPVHIPFFSSFQRRVDLRFPRNLFRS